MASSNKRDRRPILQHVENLNAEEAAKRAAETQETTTQEPANETQEATTEAHEYDLSANSDAELNELLSACLGEIKLRKQAVLNLLPPVGATVQVNAGKWKGKVGTLVQRAKTRCHVSIAGFPVAAYVLLSEVSVLANDAAS